MTIIHIFQSPPDFYCSKSILIIGKDWDIEARIRKRDWIFPNEQWNHEWRKMSDTQLVTSDKRRIFHIISSYSSFNNIPGRKVKIYKEEISLIYFAMYLVWNYTIGDAFMGVRVEPGSRPNCSLQTEWLSFSCAGTSSIGWEFEKFKRSFLLLSIVGKDFESQYSGPPKDASREERF